MEGAASERLSIRVESDDAYALTAAPVVATLLQWPGVRRPGLHSQGLLSDPGRLLEALPRLGVRVT